MLGDSVQPVPRSWPDILAWSRLTGRTLEPEEASALMEIDMWSRSPGPREAESG